MSEIRLVHEETPVEFFREQLVRAMEHLRVSTSAFTEYYLVNLLAACIRSEALPATEPGYDETPLALLYLRALEASRGERARLLRALGDNALFVAGFFGDSLERQLADRAYYRALGGRAYARLSVEEPGVALGSNVFAELAERFLDFADVLAEVSEKSRLTSQASILRLYEKWEKTRSRRAAILLAEQGITPSAAEPGRPQ